MTDVPPGSTNGGAQAVPPPSEAKAPFPAARLLYSIGFAIIAWFVFWIVLALGLIQFVVVLVNGHMNEELKSFSFSLVQYLWELLAYIVFVRDEQPFPIGPFPKHV
jgi:hypothetical protein